MHIAPSRLAPGVAALAGASLAAWLYGLGVMDPRSVQWLLHGDPAQHYLGSVFFRAEPWRWPPGAILRFGEAQTSVVFTDSIPLLALPAKLLQWPAAWQYFGIWMLLCHALAGWWGVRLVQRLGVSGPRAALAGVFFVISPAMLMRAYGHEALMAHFLLLAALHQALSPWNWRHWLLIASIAVLVHPYLALMVCTLGLCAAAEAWLRREVALPRLAWQGIRASLVLGPLAWLAGYFVGSGQVSAGGFGFFSSNLLTWLDPMDWQAFARTHGVEAPYVGEWSRWLPPQGQATQGQYEGYAYLGAGLLVLVLPALFVGRHTAGDRPAQGRAPIHWAGPLVGSLVLAAWAVSNRPAIGATLLADIPLAAWAQQAAGVFRASGRFVWPLTLLLMAWVLSRVGRLRTGLWLLALALAVQFADLSGKLDEFRARFRSGPPGSAKPVSSPEWARMLARCPRFEFVSAAGPGPQWLGPALAAAAAGASVAPAPTARLSQQAVAARQASSQAMLASQGWRADTVYMLEAPLPGQLALDEVISSLPAGVRQVSLEGRTLVVPDTCLD